MSKYEYEYDENVELSIYLQTFLPTISTKGRPPRPALLPLIYHGLND